LASRAGCGAPDFLPPEQERKPATVAAQTGTSLRMIERTYFKFIRSAMLEKISGLKARPSAQSA
jgi:hypothetical protein